MKNLFLLVTIIILAASCSTLKPASSGKTVSGTANQKQSSIEFINTVSIAPGSARSTPTVSYKKNTAVHDQPVAVSTHLSGIENYSLLQFKYAILENVEVEELSNEKLLNFIDEWYGAKYRYGGTAKGGIDCSAFASALMSSVYGISNLPRMAKDQYIATPRIGKKQLQEGDLVFFHTYGRRKTVTHVGVYLRNNKFVHASISGVMISDMSEGYYAGHYVGAGRTVEPGIRDAAAN